MKMRSLVLLAAALTAVAGAAPSFAKDKEEPKKFPYRPLPVEVVCLSGTHPTQTPDGPAFPCIADAERVAPATPPTPATVTTEPAQAPPAR